MPLSRDYDDSKCKGYSQAEKACFFLFSYSEEINECRICTKVIHKKIVSIASKHAMQIEAFQTA